MIKNKLIYAPHERQPWGHAGDNLTFVHCKLDVMKGTAQFRKEDEVAAKAQKVLYDQAKHYNNQDAAAEIVERAINQDKINMLVDLVESSEAPPIIVFPHPSFDDDEADGYKPVDSKKITNAIPFAFAAHLAQVLGATIETNVVQSARVGRTKLTLFPRFLWQPKFEGPITARLPYIIADDTVTAGGTIAALRCHIINEGGTVLCCTALAHSQGLDVKLAVARGTLDVLEQTYGGDLAGYWKESIGHEIHCLTENEASRLVVWGNSNGSNPTERIHALRERLAKAAAKGE
jgi:hypothetical protein